MLRGLTYYLYSMRRISFFNDSDVKHSNLYKTFRLIKKELINFDGNYNTLLITLRELCDQLNLNPDRVISVAKSYSEKDKTQSNIQCSLLYEALIKQRLFSLFNVQESGWHPKNGFAGLKESLRSHGAHVFVGKYGAWCHVGENKVVSYFKENINNREVYGFKKGSYAGENTTWTHAIVVDQVKIINGIEMVFFRDPYDCSDNSQKEKIYALSYESFVQRLTNQQSHRYARNDADYENCFGIVSSNPSNLIKM